MAQSSAHKLGQLLGYLFEASIKEVLNPIVIERGLYLDYKKVRQARDGKKEVKGVDLLGNSHKLDYVIEKNGTEEEFGIPMAFIEIAWRRYAKHSKNKAEEIGDVLDAMYKTYSKTHPFKGAILAGVFTKPAIEQLKSKGITVAYIDYNNIISQFSNYGLSIEWGEKTDEESLANKVSQLETYIKTNEKNIISDMIALNKGEFERFTSELKRNFDRTIAKIIVTPLHGEKNIFAIGTKAIEFIKQYDENVEEHYEFNSYEIFVEYKDGLGEIRATLQNKEQAINFINLTSNI